MTPFAPDTPLPLLELLESLSGKSGILRLSGALGVGDGILERGTLTALRLGGQVTRLELAPLSLLEWARGGEARGQFVPDPHYAPREVAPGETLGDWTLLVQGWPLEGLLEKLEGYREDLEQGLKLPEEHDLYAVLNETVLFSPPFDLFWTLVRPRIEAGQSVGEMALSTGISLYALRFGLAKLRAEGTLQKLTPTLDFGFEFRLEGP